MTEKKELFDVLMQAVAGTLADLHTATIAKVTAVGGNLIECKPVINRVVDGESIPLPVFADVPPVFLGGGSSYMSFPVAVDDYCLLIFTERCFDRWWNGTDFAAPAELRMHDYSDGFALCGLRNFASLIGIPSETTINGVMRLGVENPSDFVALASKVDAEFKRIWDLLSGLGTLPKKWVPLATDGGLALQTAAKAIYPPPSGPGDVQPTKSAFVKAE